MLFLVENLLRLCFRCGFLHFGGLPFPQVNVVLLGLSKITCGLCSYAAGLSQLEVALCIDPSQGASWDDKESVRIKT